MQIGVSHIIVRWADRRNKDSYAEARWKLQSEHIAQFVVFVKTTRWAGFIMCDDGLCCQVHWTPFPFPQISAIKFVSKMLKQTGWKSMPWGRKKKRDKITFGTIFNLESSPQGLNVILFSDKTALFSHSSSFSPTQDGKHLDCLSESAHPKTLLLKNERTFPHHLDSIS